MQIITENAYLKCGLRTLIQQSAIKMNMDDIIVDFDNQSIIITTLMTLKEITESDHSFEKYLLHPFVKINKNLSLDAIQRSLRHKNWRNRKIHEGKLSLTRKERVLLKHIIDREAQVDIFSNGELDVKTLSTHKYNMLKKVNQQSVATLNQVYHHWESFCNQPARYRLACRLTLPGKASTLMHPSVS